YIFRFGGNFPAIISIVRFTAERNDDMYKFTGFTQKANDVLNAAIEYAENMGHTYIGSEHLLLGLLTQNGGIAYTV
ncbi:MAG TPA: hypothetical protein DEF14_07300, partial [Ruminococcaceae bacterium]|nr:hypothetical protein [Oscillospiraceae bacterium]